MYVAQMWLEQEGNSRYMSASKPCMSAQITARIWPYLCPDMFQYRALPRLYSLVLSTDHLLPLYPRPQYPFSPLSCFSSHVKGMSPSPHLSP